jgi:N-glycosylase/DNA lyase
MSAATIRLASSGVLNVSKSELNLKACLKGGMSFRWQLTNESNTQTEFIGVSKENIFVLKQDSAKSLIEYSAYSSSSNSLISSQSDNDIRHELEDYFHLKENLVDLYAEWSRRDVKFREKVNAHSNVLGGIRLLRLDPVENLFSFICSSNNNIKRITQMVANMCNHFGQPIGDLNGVTYYSFPSISRLAEADVEKKLRELSFGYRAKFIYQAACYLKKQLTNDQQWLYSLRSRPYDQVLVELIKIPGIGKKVADCICLMSLDKLEAIPVDTHVLSIARNIYGFAPTNSNETAAKVKSNNLSDKAYKTIGMKMIDDENLKPQVKISILFFCC